ncbi:MAG: hypothetical protein WCE21_01900 [Candidatus Babeliales bacterium]
MNKRLLIFFMVATKTECPIHRNPIKVPIKQYHACTYSQSPLTFTLYSELPLNNRAHVLKVEYVNRYINKNNALFELVPPPASKKKVQPKLYPFQRTFESVEREGTVYHVYKANCGSLVRCCLSGSGCQDPLIKKIAAHQYWEDTIKPQIKQWLQGLVSARELDSLFANIYAVLFQSATNEIGPLLYTVRCASYNGLYTQAQISAEAAKKGGVNGIGDVLWFRNEF